MQNDERRIAVFIDFENVAMGVRESKYGNFDIDLVLKRLVEKGKIMVKRAYSDWHRYSEFKRAFHQAAIELIDVPQTRYSGKNSADIRMVVDALDLSYQKDHIDTFVLVSGDSDFSPLVSKLRENGRYVIGMGVKQSSSDLLINNCDEFIFYDDLVRPSAPVAVVDPKLHHLSPKKAEAIRLVLETFQALQREGKEVIYGSMIKQTLIRKLPSFNETYYGYPMFSRLLEDAAENKLLKLAKDQKSGGYIVTPPTETPMPAAAPSESAPENGHGAEGAALGSAAAGLPVPLEPRDRFRRGRWDRGSRRGPNRFGEGTQKVRSLPVQTPELSQSGTEAALANPETAETPPQLTSLPETSSTTVVEASPGGGYGEQSESVTMPPAQAERTSVEVGPALPESPQPVPESQPKRSPGGRHRRSRRIERPVDSGRKGSSQADGQPSTLEVSPQEVKAGPQDRSQELPAAAAEEISAETAVSASPTVVDASSNVSRVDSPSKEQAATNRRRNQRRRASSSRNRNPRTSGKKSKGE